MCMLAVIGYFQPIQCSTSTIRRTNGVLFSALFYSREWYIQAVAVTYLCYASGARKIYILVFHFDVLVWIRKYFAIGSDWHFKIIVFFNLFIDNIINITYPSKNSKPQVIQANSSICKVILYGPRFITYIWHYLKHNSENEIFPTKFLKFPFDLLTFL